MKKKIYLAGPMTGLREFNYPAFNAAADQLRALGHEVLNPAENSEPACGTYEGYLRMGLRQMLDCECVVMLPDWSASKGAVIECNLAWDLKMHVYDLAPMLSGLFVSVPASVPVSVPAIVFAPDWSAA